MRENVWESRKLLGCRAVKQKVAKNIRRNYSPFFACIIRSKGDIHLIELVIACGAQAIAAFDVEMHFKTLAASADRDKALAMLVRLDGTK